MCSVTDAIEAAKAVLTKPPLQLSDDGFYTILIDHEAHAQLIAQLERALINVDVLGRGLQALLTSHPSDAVAERSVDSMGESDEC